MSLKTVALIGTGGSISYASRHRLDLYEYPDYGRILAPEALLATVPEIRSVANVIPIPFRELSSTRITPHDWLELNELIHRVAEEHDGLSGIVVTHGTASLEETAYFLQLSLKIDLPVVIVGAQRPSDGLSTDASLNLLNAVRVAASPEARGHGVLVVLNDEIQSPREVSKTSTYRLEAFRSPDLGMLGYADPDGRVAMYRRATRAFTTATEFDVRGLTELPKVGIAYSYVGSDGVVIDALVTAESRAVVVALMAPGKPTPDEARAAAAARERGVVMIASSRAGSGRVLHRDLLWRQGFVAADNLNPQKARVLTALALTRTSNMAEIREMFEKY